MVLSLERFVGKVAVVTGASAGIGAAIAEELAKNGIIVAALARRIKKIEELASKLSDEQGQVHAFKCDVTIENEIIDTIKEVTETLGPISILVNSAGLTRVTSLIDGDTEYWKTILDTNVLGLCIVTREVIQNMKANGTEGHIIHLNSVLGHVVLNIPDFNVYGASKYAVTCLAETLRQEINRENLPIKITSVSPGYVKTEFQAGMSGELTIPGLQAADIADAIIYALSTGPNVNVSELTVQAVGF